MPCCRVILVWPLLPTHCRRRGWLLHLITLNDTHTHTHTHTSGTLPQTVELLWTMDRPFAETFAWQHTTITRSRHPCPRQDSNPQSQQASGRKTTPPGSASSTVIYNNNLAEWAKNTLKNMSKGPYCETNG